MKGPEILRTRLVHATAAQVFAAVIIGAVSYFVYTFFLYPTLLSPIRHIPYICSDWQTRLYRWVYTEPTPVQLGAWVKRTQHNGLVRYTGIGGEERVLALSSQAVKEVLVLQGYSHFERPANSRKRFAALTGHGLLAMEGEAHKTQKRKMLPAFAPRSIRELYPTFWDKACELVQELDSHVRSESSHEPPCHPVELVQYASRTSLDIIGVAAWGRDFEALRNPQGDFVVKYHKTFRGSPRANRQAKLIYAAALAVPMPTLAWLFPCEYFANLAIGRRTIRQRCVEVIQSKRDAARAEMDGKNEPSSKNARFQGKDILSGLISATDFNDEILVNQMSNILAAGHETSAAAATFACFLLCKYPEVQSRLREEVRRSLPSPSKESVSAEADALQSLPYLRAVMHEALRLIPVAPLVRRETTQDTTVLGYSIPKGVGVVVPSWVIHRLPEAWGPTAEQFDPDRWLENDHAGTGDYLPFMTGPRSCIGAGFAEAEVSALIAVMVGRFRMRLDVPKDWKQGEGLGGIPAGDVPLDEASYEPDVIWGITIKPLGLKMRLEVVEGW